MKKGHWVGTALVIVIIAAAVTLAMVAKQRRRETQLQSERRSRYEAITDKYSHAFSAGLNRKEVETRLRSSGLTFRQMCCVDVKRDTWADLVKIGEEKPPWYCNYHNVYVAFEFASSQPREIPDARDDDMLLKVRTFDWLETCL